MRGILLSDGKVTYREDLPRPERTAGEALIRIHLAGICSTDLQLLRGYRPFHGIPGHEFVGTVVESDEPQWIGRRVVGEINVPCRQCDMCRKNMPTHCRNRAAIGITGRDGAMAEYLLLPSSNLHKVPESVSDEMAVFTEPLAAALQIMEQVHILPTSRVIILGDGRLGLLAAQVISLTGCETIAVGRHADKLAILEHRGIATTLDTHPFEGSADVVVECTGNPDGWRQARALVHPRGQIILKSTFADQTAVDMSRVVVDEITLIGSRCGPFAPALRLLARRLVDVLPLISQGFRLEEASLAFAHAASKGILKVLLRP